MTMPPNQDPRERQETPPPSRPSIGRTWSPESTPEKPPGWRSCIAVSSRGIRYYLCRQLGSQELEDKVHDTFLIVVQAIRRGDLREPERLMGFVRTVVKRQVAAHIEQVIQSRRDFQPLDQGGGVSSRAGSPEDDSIERQEAEIMETCSGRFSGRDREILTRFYLLEQPQEQICAEMQLTETQFRLLKSRAKTRFGELGRKRIARRTIRQLS